MPGLHQPQADRLSRMSTVGIERRWDRTARIGARIGWSGPLIVLCAVLVFATFFAIGRAPRPAAPADRPPRSRACGGTRAARLATAGPGAGAGSRKRPPAAVERWLLGRRRPLGLGLGLWGRHVRKLGLGGCPCSSGCRF